MSDQGNRSMQQGANAARRAGRGAVKTGKTAYKTGKTFFMLPVPVKIGIVVALVFILLFGVIVGGSSSTSMDETWYLTAENGKDEDHPANAPKTEEELTSVKSRYNSIKQTAELAQIIEEAKREDRAAIEAQIQKTYGDKNVTIECDSDTEEFYISDIYSLGGAGAGGNGNAGELAVKWAIEKANESKQGKWFYVYFGRSGTGKNGVKKSTSCPLCKPNSASQGWQCIGFVSAAYFHGAGVPSDIHRSTTYCHLGGFGTGGGGGGGTLDGKNPDEVFRKWKARNGEKWQMISTGSLTKGYLKDSELQAGDILLCYENGNCRHMALYAGDGKVVESSGGSMNGGKGGIYYHKGTWTRKRTRIAMRYTGGAGASVASQISSQTPAGSTPEGQKIVDTAMKYVGKVKYKHGGSSLKTGLDCTAFVWRIYNLCGYKMNAHFGSKGVSIGKDINKAQPGDVIKYRNHWAIYAGNKKVVHCTGGYGVCVWKYTKPQGGSGILDIRRYVTTMKPKGGSKATAATADTSTSYGSAADIPSYKKVKVLAEIKRKDGKKKTYTGNGTYNVGQSMALTNSGNYVIAWDHNPSIAKSRISLYDANGKHLSDTVVNGYHSNASTVAANGEIWIGGWLVGDSATVATLTESGNKLKSTGTKRVRTSCSSGIAYDKETKKYILASGPNIYVYNTSMTSVERTISKKHGLHFQDMGAANGVIYVCHSLKKGNTRAGSGNNYIDLFRESDGAYLGSYHLDYGEIQSCVINGGELVILNNIKGSRDCEIQWTGIRLLGGPGAGAGAVALDDTTGISKSDLEILSAYSISLANSELVFDEKAKNSKVEDAIFGRYFNKEESKKGAKKGKPVKLYWFGEDRGKVNYPKDLKPKVKAAEFYSRDYEVSESGDSVKVTLKTRKAHELMQDMFDISPDDEYVNAKRAGLDLNVKSEVSDMSTNAEVTYSLANNTAQLLFDGKTVVRSTADTGGSAAGFGLFAGGTLNFPLNPKGVIVTSPFAWRWGRQHEGVDLSGGGGNAGQPIYAAAAGKVSVVQNSYTQGSGPGKYVNIDHGNGMVTRYLHQSKIVVKQGDQVQAGQLIGYVGNTGHSFGAHLHFEVRINGKAVDPTPYIGIKNKAGFKCEN